MVNLSVDESARRASSIDISRYEVSLDLDRGDVTFESTTSIEFQSRDGEATFFELVPHQVHRMTLNGDVLDAALLRDDRVVLQPQRGLNELRVHATMAYSHDGEGLHRSVDPEDGNSYVYAMTFLDAAPRVFAAFDQPDLKAPLSLSVRAPADWIVLGNGRATRLEAEDAPDGQAGWWRLLTTRPLSTYFMTLAAGPYHSVVREHDGIRLGLHARRTLAPFLDADADEMFTITEQCFDEYHRLFGIRYAFGDYHQVFVPEFNAGAMENPGCVTFRDELVFRAQPTQSARSDRANVIAHEMAHQWFGDLVTMKWWDDLWLNESFADYMGHRVCVEATAFTDNWLMFALSNKSWGLDADQRSSTHPVAGNGAPDSHAGLTNFDGISYSKGAVVLRQLANYLGDEAFLAGIIDHLTAHSFGNATLSDLIQAWERASGKDLTPWVQDWLLTSGVDTLAVKQGNPTVIERTNGSPVATSRPHALSVTLYQSNGSTAEATTVRTVLDGDTNEVALDSSAEGALVLPDSAGESWAKILLDPAAVSKLPVLLPTIGDVMSRAVIWGALREGMQHALIDPQVNVDTLTAALPFESNDLVVERVLGQAIRIDSGYFHRPDHQGRLAALAAELLGASEPGTNRQLVTSRQVIDSCTNTSLLWSWLDGHAPEGLLIDADMRWRLLERLCILGAAGQDEIAQEQAADPSSQGALAAVRCEASLPDDAVKADIWRRITTDPAVSNHDLYAMGMSFFQPSQRELTDPYVPRYFAEMPETATLRSGWVVESSCRSTFPESAPTDEAIAAAEAALRRDDLDQFVRRAFSDGTDDLRRVRASQAAYPAE